METAADVIEQIEFALAVLAVLPALWIQRRSGGSPTHDEIVGSAP